MSLDPSPEPDRLTGWKDIAAFLHKDVRTLHRWILEGLPVQRVRIGKKPTVYASKAEIEAWLKRRSEPPKAGAINRAEEPQETGSAAEAARVSAPPVPTGRPLRQWWPWLVAAGVAAAIAVVWLFRFGPLGRRVPASWQVIDKRLEVYDERGSRLWKHEFGFGLDEAAYRREAREGGPSAVIDDLDGDGHREILFTSQPLGLTVAASENHRLYCFNADGSPRFEYSSRSTMVFPAERHDPPFGASRFVLTPEVDGSKSIWLVSIHHRDFSSTLQKLTSRGSVVGEYWSKGHIWGLPRDAVVGGRRVMLVGATDNEFRGGSLAILDYGQPSGASPAVAPKYRCTNCPEGRPFAFFVFPEMELSAVSGGRAYVTDASVGSDNQLTVRVHQGGGNHENPVLADAYYRFDQELQLVAAEMGDSYRTYHAQLEREGLISHRYGPQDVAQRFPVLAWGGWGFSRIDQPISDARHGVGAASNSAQ